MFICASVWSECFSKCRQYTASSQDRLQTQQLGVISCGVRVTERLFGEFNCCKRVVAGAAAAAVCLPEPGGEAAGEPESEQEAGGGRGRQSRGAGRGGQERPHSASGPDSTSQGSGADPEEDAWHGGLNISNIREMNVGTDLKLIFLWSYMFK